MSDTIATVRAVYDAMNTRDFAVFDRLYAPDVTFNGAPSSPEVIRQYCSAYLQAFPDLDLTVEHAISDGTWVAARVVARGTHTADLEGIPATGRSIEVAQHDLVRVTDGRLTDCWTVFDQFAMLQQLGVLPAGQPA